MTLAWLLPLRAGSSSTNWIGVSGSWNQGPNWSGGAVPSNTDLAGIFSGTVSVDAAGSVGGILLSGGQIAGPSALTLLGTASEWTQGSLTGGELVISSGAQLLISGPSVKDFRQHQITNQGTINWTGGELRSGDGGTITNQAGATFNDATTANYYFSNYYSGVYDFVNQGTYNKTGTSTTSVYAKLVNSGAMNIQAGELQLSGGGQTDATGSFNVSSGAKLMFVADYSVADASDLLGSGAYQLYSGTLTLDGTLNSSAFTQTGGRLLGTQTFTAGYTWQGGNWVADATGPSTTNAAGSTLTISTASTHDFKSRAIVNQGTINWTGGELRSGLGGTITNQAGATFNDATTANYYFSNYYGGVYDFVNAGTYNKTGTSTTSVYAKLVNSGAMNIQAGELQL
ncbi:MAG: hypothetical protein WC378_07590, partial [Opitutaceae bacterium]